MQTLSLAARRETCPPPRDMALPWADPHDGPSAAGPNAGRLRPAASLLRLADSADHESPMPRHGGVAVATPARTPFGSRGISRLAELLRQLSEDTLRILADGGDGQSCLDHLACMLEYVPDVELVKRILNNRCLRARRSRIPNLLADFAGSDLSFANADTVLGALAGANASGVYGRCFEVRAAAHLKQRHGVVVLACDKVLGGTNTDLLDDNGVLYQCKAWCEKSYECRYWTLRRWCKAALRRTSDPAKIKWVVPQRRRVHVRFLAYLRRAEIEVVEVPFCW